MRGGEREQGRSGTEKAANLCACKNAALSDDRQRSRMNRKESKWGACMSKGRRALHMLTWACLIAASLLCCAGRRTAVGILASVVQRLHRESKCESGEGIALPHAFAGVEPRVLGGKMQAFSYVLARRENASPPAALSLRLFDWVKYYIFFSAGKCKRPRAIFSRWENTSIFLQ